MLQKQDELQQEKQVILSEMVPQIAGITHMDDSLPDQMAGMLANWLALAGTHSHAGDETAKNLKGAVENAADMLRKHVAGYEMNLVVAASTGE